MGKLCHYFVEELVVIKVLYFASLREQVGKSCEQIAPCGIKTASDVWQKTNGCALSAASLVAINMQYAKPEDKVQDGDEVAFFPPVNGG